MGFWKKLTNMARDYNSAMNEDYEERSEARRERAENAAYLTRHPSKGATCRQCRWYSVIGHICVRNPDNPVEIYTPDDVYCNRFHHKDC